jgi:hypothetical protein
MRWFNGTAWTADVSNDGVRMVDPLGAAPMSSGGQKPAGNGIAVAAMCCGIAALLFAWTPFGFVVGLILAVLALVFGIRGIVRARTVGRNRGMAIAGVATGALGVALTPLGIVFTVAFVREIRDFAEPGRHTAEVTSCTVEPGAFVVQATLTNLSDKTRDYTAYAVIDADLVAGVQLKVDEVVLEVEDLAPDTTRELEFRSSRVTSNADLECRARIVIHGPTPFGIEMDRLED